MMSWYFTNSNVAEDFFKIDAKTLYGLWENEQMGVVSNGDLKIRFDGSGEEMTASFLKAEKWYKQIITFKESKVGYGMRIFVICPHCKKSCNHLYLKFGFACLKCNGLYYTSNKRQHNELERERLEIRKTQSKLKMTAVNIMDRPDEKPLHMHWNTFETLYKSLLNHQVKYAKLKKARLKKLEKRFNL